MRIALLAVLAFASASAVAQLPELRFVSEKRITRTVFEYQYQLAVVNNGTGSWDGLAVTVASTSPHTTIVKATVNFGSVPGNTKIYSQDNLVLRHDRTVPFDRSRLVFSGTVGQPVAFTPPAPRQDLIDALPKNPETGRPILSLAPGAKLELDTTTREPSTAVGMCTRWVGQCVRAGGGSLDDCTRSVPVCTTDTPWNEAACCPSACQKQYAALRLGGTAAIPAFSEAFFHDGSCFPGFAGLRALQQ